MIRRVLLLTVLATLAAGGTAHAAAISLSVTPDPTEEKPLTITAAGSTETSRTLYVYISSTQSSCPSVAQTAENNYLFTRLTGYSGTSVAAGTFSKTLDYTPTDNGNYLVCGYISNTASAAPAASTSLQIGVREPTGTLGLSISSDRTEEKPLTITAAGSAEVARTLYVYISSTQSSCPSVASTAENSYLFTRLTGYSGTSVAAGTFSKTLDYTPTDNGNYLVCGYIAETFNDPPIATANGSIDRNAVFSVTAPPSVESGQVVPISLTGTTYTALSLSALVAPAATGCKPTREDQADQSGVVSVLVRTPAPAGPIAANTSFGPAAPGTYIVCAYGESTSATLTASAQFVIKPDPALFPILLGQDEDEHRDRLFLRWWRATGTRKDHILVYDREPGVGTPPIWDADLDGNGVTAVTDGDIQEARITHLGYGTFWWRIRRTDGTTTIYGPVQRVRIVPRPLARATAAARATVRRTRSSRRPGSARIAITSSPLAKVKVVVRNHGRTILKRSYTEGVGGKRGITTKLSCARTGRTSYRVTMTDPYKTTITRKGSWTLTARRCQALRNQEAAKRRAAARRAAERRAAAQRQAARERQANNNGGGSGGGSVGCDGDPNATPYPQHPGQRDGDHDGCYGET